MNYVICITQSKYVKEILKFFGLEDSKLVSTPMVTAHKLSKNDDYAKVNQTLYRSMIGKLQYVVHRRPDIALSIGTNHQPAMDPLPTTSTSQSLALVPQISTSSNGIDEIKEMMQSMMLNIDKRLIKYCKAKRRSWRIASL